MKKALFYLSATLCMTWSVASASEAGASRVQKEHQLAMLQWKQQLATAPSQQAKAALLKNAPDFAAFGASMMREIGADLNKDWTLPYSTWLMQNHPKLLVKEVLHLMSIVEKSQIQSPEIGKFCIALVGAAENDSSLDESRGNVPYQVGFLGKKINFIEKVLQENANKRVQGEASLALSVALGKMGVEADLNDRRLKLLRTAIIEAVDSKVGEVTVKEIAEEELYRMTKLSKGRKAPELVGQDAHGNPMKLSDHNKGKVVMLVFWASWESGEQVVDYLKKSTLQHEGKPVAIVGVNKDTTADLKAMVDVGKIPGVHFSDPNTQLFSQYRVDTTPWCYVLDQEGVIRYLGPVGSFVDLTIDAVLTEKKK